MKKIRTVGCFMEYNSKFLILLRQAYKPDGNTWGLPAGKPNVGESDVDAMLREIDEETGYKTQASELKLLGVHVFEYPDLYLEFPTYQLKLNKSFKVVHRPEEHVEYRWVSAQECDAMPDLIRGFHELLRRVGFIKKTASDQSVDAG